MVRKHRRRFESGCPLMTAWLSFFETTDTKVLMANQKFSASPVRLGTTKGKPVRFSHLHVFKPHLNTESKKEEYSTQLWIPKDNVEDKAALDAAYAEQLANYKKVDGEPGPKFHNPIKDGDKLTDKKGRPKPVPGMWVISAKTAAKEDDGTLKDPPGVVGTERDAKGELIPLTSSQIKSGDFGRASINLKFFTKGDAGVGVYLNSLQKTRVGDALGSRKSASEEFGDYDEDEDEGVLG